MERDTWKSPKWSWGQHDVFVMLGKGSTKPKCWAKIFLVICWVNTVWFVPLCWLHASFQCKTIWNAAHLNVLLNLVFWECHFPPLRGGREFLDPQFPGYSAIGTATTHSTQYTPHPPGKHLAPRFHLHGNDGKHWFGKQWFFWLAF